MEIVGGVDTHSAVHCVAAMDKTGRLLATAEFPAQEHGYRELVGWLRGHGNVQTVGVEGTGAYGAGLARYLLRQGLPVMEVPRPDRRLRRSRGKSDPIDAEAAARSVVSGTATILPKIADGPIEALRLLRVARQGAVKARTAAANTLRGLLVTAPEALRSQLPRTGSATAIANKCRRLRPRGDDLADPTQAAKLALLSVAGRVAALDEEVRLLDRRIADIVQVAAPATAALFAVGPETASALLVAIGDNPDRLRSERALARLCGAAPIPASSGKTTRHRLHRGGDRSANRALHTVVIVRMRYCPRTRAYVARRTADGLSKREVIRCLKRYLVREVFGALRADYASVRRLDNL